MLYINICSKKINNNNNNNNNNNALLFALFSDCWREGSYKAESSRFTLSLSEIKCAKRFLLKISGFQQGERTTNLIATVTDMDSVGAAGNTNVFYGLLIMSMFVCRTLH